jgi:serine/threonine protein kinase
MNSTSIMLQHAVQQKPHISKPSKDSVEHKRHIRNRPPPQEPVRPSHPVARHSPLSVATNFPPSTPTSPLSSPSKPVPRSPYISSRQVSSPVSGHSPLPPNSPNAPFGRPHSLSSVSSSTLENILSPRDIVGEGCRLQDELIRLVSIGKPPVDDEEPAREFEVIRQLGTGSYAVVYEVLEVLSRPPPSDEGHMSLMGSMELDDQRSCFEYGRHYAIKCLSKANLDHEALAAQMSEVTIHQSLRSHPNIVTLHRTLETDSFLLLLLEFVPGEDLFYFLEQSRDHYDSESPTNSSTSSLTPPTPSLLSNLHPSQLLSRTRLRLISSMFSQMCEAVAACHDQQVFHRDIKPENFIVTDGWTTLPDGRRERKVIVKLSDFGLSTKDVASYDMDCGSAPYMSYECRNNIAPSYSPRAADVWSLGIVLINMLYHYNPWTDTSYGACPSFDHFRRQPVNFFLQRFPGMTRPAAEHLANKVFCILDDPSDDSARMGARDFGVWVKDLPSLLSGQTKLVHKRVASTSSSQNHPIASSVPASHRPSSRNTSRCCTPVMWTPALRARSLSRAPSGAPSYDTELSTVVDQESFIEEQDEREGYLDPLYLLDMEPEGTNSDIESTNSRPPSSHKRRKRGARRGKNLQSPTSPKDETLNTLANASQSLAREVSRASRSSSMKTTTSTRSWRDVEPASMYAVPSAPPPVPPLPTVAKKPSKWKLSFGKSSSTDKPHSPVEEVPPVSMHSQLPSEARGSPKMSSTAANVGNIIRDLDPPQPKRNVDSGKRERRTGEGQTYNNSGYSSSWIPPTEQTLTRSGNDEGWPPGVDPHSASPPSMRTSRQQTASSTSTYSHNWRSSMSTTSSAMTSTSAFTRYSNSSVRSVSTAATSVSSSSWRTHNKSEDAPIPRNVKILNGVPWELDELPRQMRVNPTGDVFGSQSSRKQRSRKPNDVPLDTITERPGAHRSPLSQDASRSMTDLEDVDSDGPKKVQKGQINALAKMLSALRR